MSNTKYILIYPFTTREQAFDVGNNIDGSLMWENGTAYPNDNIPAFIVPVTEFSNRWTAPNEIQQLQSQLQTANERIKVLEEALLDIIYFDGEKWFVGQMGDTEVNPVVYKALEDK